MTSTTPTAPGRKPRCPHCGGRLEDFEGEPCCPDCLSWTTSPEAIEMRSHLGCDEANLVDLARDG